MKVLHVSQPTTAGVKVVVRDIVREQLAAGFSVAVACPESPTDLSGEVQRLGAIYCNWEATRNPGRSVFAEVKSLKRVIADVEPDVVHLHSSKAGLAGRLANRGRLPTVFEPNAWSFLAVSGLMKAAATSWERMAARWTHATICVSDEEKSTAEKLRIRNPMYVVPNGLPLANWPAPNREETLAARELLMQSHPGTMGPVVVSVGRLCRQKGQDLLLKAWRNVRSQHPMARLFLIGDGSDRELLQPLADESVTFIGPSNAVRNWYLAADLVVMPSRWEGLSLALLEAMATQRCVVAFDVAGMRDALRNEAGVLVPPESVEAFASAICRQLGDTPTRLILAANARSRIEQRFDIQRKHADVASIYDSIRLGKSRHNQSIADA